VKLNRTASGQGEPLKIATDFYTHFSKPRDVLYSWNRSFTEDKAQFLAEKLAFYFGYGSEGTEIEQLNPNLNFDIAEVPQGEKATIRRTYGRQYGLAVLRSSNNLSGTGVLLPNLAGSENIKRLADEYHMVPALRGLAAQGSNDTYGRVAYKSATVAYGWLSPRQTATDEIFEALLLDVNENRQDIAPAVSDTLSRLELEYR
jgi:hypothetical protein